MSTVKKLGFGLVMFAVVLAIGHVLYAPPTTTPGLDDAYGRAVFIRAYDPNDNYLWSGSGVIVYDQMVATAKHLVEQDNHPLPARLEIIKDGQVYNTTIWRAHATKDIALAIVPGLEGTMAKYGSAQNLDLGTSLYIVGHPAALDSIWITQGILSSYSNTDIPLWDDVVGSDAECMGGSSGSGIYTAEGVLVGIVVGKYEDLTFCVDLRYLWEIEK